MPPYSFYTEMNTEKSSLQNKNNLLPCLIDSPPPSRNNAALYDPNGTDTNGILVL